MKPVVEIIHLDYNALVLEDKANGTGSGVLNLLLDRAISVMCVKNAQTHSDYRFTFNSQNKQLTIFSYMRVPNGGQIILEYIQDIQWFRNKKLDQLI
jgi:hypothetical protein